MNSTMTENAGVKGVAPLCWVKGQSPSLDDHSNDVLNETPEPRKGKRARKAKSYSSDFQLYLVEGSRDQIGSQYSYCYSIEEDPRTYNEAMQYRDVALVNLWKIIHGSCFRQKERIDYFDTYAPVARITTIKFLIALLVIHNLVIHQTDVKTTFLNDDLEEEVYMKQPKGFVIPRNEHKFFMKDMREADVILGIKIKRQNKGIVITQSYYIKKILKKFNREVCSPMSTPIMDRALLDLILLIAVGRLSRFTSNPRKGILSQERAKQAIANKNTKRQVQKKFESLISKPYQGHGGSRKRLESKEKD
ncbi:zinc finger, CCHC-type containing protein [Tanacetum coccineum]